MTPQNTQQKKGTIFKEAEGLKKKKEEERRPEKGGRMSMVAAFRLTGAIFSLNRST